MGDVDHRRLERLVQLGDLEPHLHPQRRVEVRQGFVEQERRRVAHDRPSDRHPLALPAGEVLGAALKVILQLQHPGRLVDHGRDLRLCHPRRLQREPHVVAHRHVRIKRVRLEHHGKAALRRRLGSGVAPVDQHLPARGLFEPGDHAQKCRLSAAGGADEDDELTFLDRQVDTLDDLHGAEPFFDRFQLDAGHEILPVVGDAQASQTAAVQVKLRPPAAVPSRGSKYSANPPVAITSAVFSRKASARAQCPASSSPMAISMFIIAQTGPRQ